MYIMGGSTANKKWIHPHCIIAAATTDNNNNTNDELNVYFNSQIINSVVSTPSSTQKHIDLGATDHQLKNNPNPTYPASKKYNSITITLPNGTKLKSTQDCKLPITKMDNNAISGHVIPTLNKSLISIGKICDANYMAVFTKKDVNICSKPIPIADNNVVFKGHRNYSNGLYFADLNGTTNTFGK